MHQADAAGSALLTPYDLRTQASAAVLAVQLRGHTQPFPPGRRAGRQEQPSHAGAADHLQQGSDLELRHGVPQGPPGGLRGALS